MASDKPIPVEAITKLADDIRLIQNFSANNNFDSALVSAQLSPSRLKRRINWAAVGFTTSVVAFVLLVGYFSFVESIPAKINRFLFLLGVLDVGLCGAQVHYRYRVTTVTWIIGIAMFVTLVVASGMFTLREAIEIVKPK